MPRHPIFTLLATLALALPAAGCGHPAVAAAPAALRSGAAAVRHVGATPADPAAPDLTTLPRFARTGSGDATDPVNLVIAADGAALAHAFLQAGWLPADPVTFRAVVRLIKAAVTGGEYPTAPISPLYLYGERQAFAFQKNAKSVVSRDHLRIWRTPLADQLGRPYWAVSATRDVSLGWNKSRPIHHIDPDLDAERRLVVSDLEGLGVVTRRSAYRAFEPGFRGRNGEGDPYFTDGLVEVLELVPDAPPT